MNACKSCNGVGWFVRASNESESGSNEIEKCDTCNRFKDDDEAARHVVNSYKQMIRALKSISLACSEDRNIYATYRANKAIHTATGELP